MLDSDVDDIQSGAAQIPLAGIEGALGEYADPESESPLGNIRNGVVNVRDYGTTAAKINEAATAAKAAGALLVGRGTFLIDETVTIACDADFSAATFACDDNTLTALRIGTTTSGQKVGPITVHAPRVVQAKPGTGWSGSDVGVEIANLFWSTVRVPYVSNFQTGLMVTAYGYGTCYNTIDIGYLFNNQFQQVWRPGVGAWTTECRIVGGWFYYAENEGEQISGTRHILLDGTNEHINGLVFLQPSLEGDSPELHVEAINAGHNLFIKPRCETEDLGEGCKWRLDGSGSQFNEIMSPTNMEAIVVTEVNGARKNSVLTPDQYWWRGGGSTAPSAVLQSGISGGMLLACVEAADPVRSDAQTNYLFGLFEQYTRLKATADTHPRLQIEHATGRLGWGPGDGAVDVTFGRLAAGLVGSTNDRIAGGSFRVGGDTDSPRLLSGSADPEGAAVGTPGSLYLRKTGQVYRKATGSGDTGWVELT